MRLRRISSKSILVVVVAVVGANANANANVNAKASKNQNGTVQNPASRAKPACCQSRVI